MSSLTQLYNTIQNCHACPDMDPIKALRNHSAVDVDEMDVFIVSQSLAERQLRRSGINFFQTDARLGRTGKALEKFLNPLRRTVYPPRAVQLTSDVIIPRRQEGLRSVYNTEIAQCFPGKSTKGAGDRKPTEREMRQCVEQGFLHSEIEALQPRLILLMGASSRIGFYRHVLGERAPFPNLTTHISTIVQSGEIPVFEIRGVVVHVMPIQHASGLNPRYKVMRENTQLISLLRSIL